MKKVYKYVMESIVDGKLDKEVAVKLLKMIKQEEIKLTDDIAIIGMSAKLPGADNVNSFWQNIKNGVDSVNSFPISRQEEINSYVKQHMEHYDCDLKYQDGAYLNEVDEFDYKFFRLSPKEASVMDPIQRLFLQTVWNTIEDAGYGGKRLKGSKTGVYLGYSGNSTYQNMIFEMDPASLPISIPGNIAAIIPSRISYLKDLKGPTMLIDTACSSSLVSVHLACKAIKDGECDFAIAGGARLNLLPIDNPFLKMGIETSDGRTRSFDNSADGAGWGEGVAAVLLKPLSRAIRDKDNIYAVIKGSSINQDGTSIGITAPNPSAQAEVILKSWEDADISPETVGYIEAHGTATNLGDPIEIDGLQRAFKKFTDKKQFCAIGSVKTNIGHLFECAGMASLIKMIMALKEKEIPPNIHFDRPNSKINFGDSPVFVNTRLRKWEAKDHPRRGGVSAFGLSGTNCHIILEEAPLINTIEVKDKKDLQVLTLSAATYQSLKELVKNYEIFLEDNKDIDIESLCYTANTGRENYGYRLAIILKDYEDLKDKLQKLQLVELKEVKEPWLFYGEHRIVSENKEGKRLGDISEREKNQLMDKLKEKITSFIESGSGNYEMLSDICSLYVRGAEVEWSQLYSLNNVKRLSIPCYPFQADKCWFDLSKHHKGLIEKLEKKLYYNVSWQVEQVKAESKREENGSTLILKDERGIGEALREKLKSEGRTVIEVEIGETFIKESENSYIISGSEEDYDFLFEDLKDSNLNEIIHLFTITKKDEIREINELHNSEIFGTYSLFYITRALVKMNFKQNINLFLLSMYANEITGTEKRINPENAPLLSMAKVIKKEVSNIVCKAIDIDEDTTIDEIIMELMCTNDITQVAYRNGLRYVEEFGHQDFEKSKSNPIELKENGVYIITGGFGGIGLETAKFLSKKHKVKLVLLNRSQIPDREKWQEIIEANEEISICKKIKIIKGIEATGSQIQCYSVDISKADDVQAVIESIRKEYGQINGVIQGAGVSKDEFLVNRKFEIFENILNPKIKGTWILDKLTEKDNLDFFVMYSSVATIFSTASQGDYVAANAYMDSFSAYRRKQGKKTLTINWTTWQETGMAAESGHAIDTIFKTLPTETAIKGLEEMLNKDINKVLIGEINYEGVGLYLLEGSKVKLSSEIKSIMEEYKGKSNKIKSSKAKSSQNNGEVKLLGKNDGKYTEIEKKIAEICNEILGFNEIDIHDNFFELGADSILLIKIQSQVEEQFPNKATVVDMFQHSTISRLAKFIVDKDVKKTEFDSIKAKKHVSDEDDEIAIIGISINFPKSNNLEDFWVNIKNQTECGAKFSENRKVDVENLLKFKNIPLNSVEYDTGVYLEEIDKFDYNFFRISPKEASFTDPQQRLFLESAWHAIEDAGYGGNRIMGTKTGVYVGFSPTAMYMRLINEVDPAAAPLALVGNTTAVTTGRLSYLLDLKGPSMVVDTACSSSLVAVHVACKSIKNGDCEMALAGGIRINMMPVSKKGEKSGIGMDSSDGKTRTFDDSSDGTGSGEGVAVLLLKPLKKAIEDRDNIYAVIKGTAINQDGSSAGITAPNPEAQGNVISMAWEDAGVDPESIAYIEAHGTGTQLGDTIEMKGIENAFRRYTDKKQFCALGSVKTNLGHLSESAGIAGIVKAVLSLKKKSILPQVNFHRPNRKINFSESPVYISTRLRPWKADKVPRRCGVSAFGMSGTNCHVILEEAPEVFNEISDIAKLNVLTISAKTKEVLVTLVKSYQEYLKDTEGKIIEDICYTANTGRGHYNYRVAIAAIDMSDLVAKIDVLCNMELERVAEPWLYYRNSKEDIIEVSKTQEVLIEEYINGDNKALDDLCRLYIKGEEIQWTRLYEENIRRKISIPVYPFLRTRCWVDVPEITCDNSAVSNGLYYSGVWLKEKFKSIGKRIDKGTIVIFKGQALICEEIVRKYVEEDFQVVEVVLGTKFAMLEANKYTISKKEEDYKKLFNQLKNRKIVQIIHILSVSKGEIDSIEKLEDSQLISTYSLFYITRSILNNGIKKGIDVVLMSNYVNEITKNQDRINPENSPLFGLGKVVRQEYPQVICRCIDIDDFTKAEDIFEELKEKTFTYEVAYRKGIRYVEEIRDVEIEYAEDSKVEIKDEGVYIITGGTGGIGMEIAKLLSANNKINIAFINRSKMPAASDNPKLIKKINEIKEIEENGTKVLCYQADISDFYSVKKIIDELRETQGKINGIIHCAGIAGDGFLFKKDEKQFTSVLDPKIKGTWILDNLTKEDNLDFVMLSSSVAAIFNGPGEGDYAAANSYLDAYSTFRNKKGKKTLAVNWVAWKETGMAVDYGVNFDGLFKALTTKKAINAFEKVLNKDIARVIIGEVNLGTDNMLQLDNVPIRLSYKLKAAVEEVKQRYGNIAKGNGLKYRGPVKLKGRENDVYSSEEIAIAQIWGDVLGFDEIGIQENYYEMGGDSILGMKIANTITEELDKSVSVVDLLQYPTIEALVVYLQETGSESEVSDEEVYPSIVPVEEREYYPVSSAQKRMFILDQFEGDSTSYNIYRAALIQNDFDVERFENILKTLVDRHESLRTTFEFINGEPVQKINKEVSFEIQYMKAEENSVDELIMRFKRPFNLSKAPLFRIGLVKLTNGKSLLLYDMHHIITDGLSMEIFIEDFINLYKGVRLKEMLYQYKDFSEWQNKILQSSLIKKQERYWVDAFSGDIPVLRLPTDYQRPLIKSYEGDRVSVFADKELTSLLYKYSIKTKTTLYMVLLASFNVLLSKYAAQEDIIIGTPIAGRHDADLEKIIGMFVNTLAMRNYPKSEKTFSQFLEEIRINALDAYKNQDYQFEELTSQLNIERDLSRNPLFDVMFALQNLGIKDEAIDDFNCTFYEFGDNTSNFDLTLEVYPKKETLRFNMEFCTKLFKTETINRMLNDYLILLGEVISNPHLKIGEIQLDSGKLFVPVYNDEEDVEFNF